MTPFETELYNKVASFYKKHLVMPQGISLSRDFYCVFYTETKAQMIIGVGADWKGMRIKFVNRKNYIECMPRMKFRYKRLRKINSSEYAGLIKTCN